MAPVLIVFTASLVKLLYFGILLDQQWWSPPPPRLDEPFAQFYVLFATVGCLLLVLAPVLATTGRLRSFLLGAIYVALSLLLLADLLHVSYYGVLIAPRRVAQVRLLTDVIVATQSAWDWSYTIYLADVVAILGLVWIASRNSRRWGARPPIVMAGIGLVCWLPVFTLVRVHEGGLSAAAGLQRDLADLVGILPLHVLEASSAVVGTVTPAQAPVEEAVRWFTAHRNSVSEHQSALFGVARGRNVIQVSAESLQAFLIGLTIDGQEVTPHLNALAKESLHFTRFFDQAFLGTTSDAEFLTNQSLYPLVDDVVSQGYATNRWRGSARVLAEHGYTTLSACGADPGFWRMEDMHRGFGFARSFFDTAYRSTEPVDAWRFVSDSVFLPRTVKVLQEQPSPFFAYLLTSTNHDPYLVPQQERQLNLTSVPDQRLANYLESVRRFDNAFGDFVSALDAAGILDTTVLVIYGDHQGFLNDSDSLARLLGVSPDDRFEMWRNRKHLPLFIRLPGGAHAGERADVGGHLDVAPTVLSLVGISPAAEVMMGRDLTSGGPGMVVFRDGSYVDDRHYFINYFGPIRRARCYELATGRPTSCEPMRERRALAQEQLGVSDRIVTGDLVPDVRAALASAASAGHHDSSSSRSSRSR